MSGEDIVERLRQMGDWIEPKVWQHDPTAWEAADEIERLRCEIAERWSHDEYRKMQDDEIERLREELEYWKHRYAKDHFPPRPQAGEMGEKGER